MTKRYEASIWPATSGHHDFVAVAGGDFASIDDAINLLMEHPAVAEALTEEDPRLSDGFIYEDVNWMEDCPEKSAVAVYGGESDDEDEEEYPFVAICSRGEQWLFRCHVARQYAGCSHDDEDEARRCQNGDSYASYWTDLLGGDPVETERFCGSTRKDH